MAKEDGTFSALSHIKMISYLLVQTFQQQTKLAFT